MDPVAAPVVLSARALRKAFGNEQAVAGLDFEVRRGECFGLLGPNGAGKSTTLKLCLGLLAPDSGKVRLLDHPIPQMASTARRRVGVVSQHDGLDPDFTVTENLIVYGRYFGLSTRQARERVGPLLEFAGLQAKAQSPIDALSGGMKRRLAIARALINKPDVLFLDEPTTGLDPQARHLIWERLKQLLVAGTTIVLTTHFMDEAQRLCDRLAVIDHGRLVALDTPAHLIEREIEPEVLELSGEGAARWAKALVDHGLASRTETVGDEVLAYVAAGAGASLLSARPGAWAPEPPPTLRVLRRPANLEDVFLKLTGRELRD
jgi:lipooligosaccharide transport system ATP-binding protein